MPSFSSERCEKDRVAFVPTQLPMWVFRLELAADDNTGP